MNDENVWNMFWKVGVSLRNVTQNAIRHAGNCGTEMNHKVCHTFLHVGFYIHEILWSWHKILILGGVRSGSRVYRLIRESLFPWRCHWSIRTAVLHRGVVRGRWRRAETRTYGHETHGEFVRVCEGERAILKCNFTRYQLLILFTSRPGRAFLRGGGRRRVGGARRDKTPPIVSTRWHDPDLMMIRTCKQHKHPLALPIYAIIQPRGSVAEAQV